MKEFFDNLIGLLLVGCWLITFGFVTVGCVLESATWVLRLLGVI